MYVEHFASAVPVGRVRIRWGAIVLVALSWSYLLQPTAARLPGPLWVQTLGWLAIPLIFAGVYWHHESVLTVRRRDIARALAIGLLYSLVCLGPLREALTSDELYHAEHAVFYLHATRSLVGRWPFLAALPVTTINGALMTAATLILLSGIFLYRRLPATVRLALPALAILGFALIKSGLLHAQVPGEPHPPLRTLPLYVCQMFLGLRDYPFRLPGLVTCVVLAVGCARWLDQHRPQSIGVNTVVAASTGFIPVVLGLMTVVEPSIWCFAAAVLLFLLLSEADRKADDGELVTAGLVIGLACLMRSTSVILWPLLGGWVAFRAKDRRCAWRAFLPILFAVPFFAGLAVVGHPAFRGDAKPVSVLTAPEAVQPPSRVARLGASVIHPDGAAAILRSTTWPWAAAALAGLGWVLFRSRSPLRAFLLIVPIGYVVFHVIEPSLWPMARYQAEYVAPAIAAVFLLVAAESDVPPAWLGACVALLCVVSVGAQRWASSLAHVAGTFSRPIFAEVRFPYKKGFDAVRRARVGGHFLVIGGATPTSVSHLWLRGFSAADVEVYKRGQKNYWARRASFAEPRDFQRFLEDTGVKAIVVHVGSPIDETLKTDADRLVIRWLESGFTPLGKIEAVAGYSDGSLDIYAAPSLETPRASGVPHR